MTKGTALSLIRTLADITPVYTDEHKSIMIIHSIVSKIDDISMNLKMEEYDNDKSS